MSGNVVLKQNSHLMSGHSKWSKVKRFKGALDAKRGVMFVTNHGSVHQSSVDSADYLSAKEKEERAKLVNWPLDRDFAVPGSGRALPPAITVGSANSTAPK